jgi:hypothetical protein
MKTRISLMKRATQRRLGFASAYGLLLAAPRVLVPLTAVAAACSAGFSCVPATRYEEASSAADVESEAHRRASLALAAERAKVAELEAELKRRDQGLDAQDQKLAQEQFAHGVAAKELNESSSLLEQLRADLARANENLQSYAADKARLEREAADKARLEREAAAQKAPPAPSETNPISELARELRSALVALGLESRVQWVERDNGLSVQLAAGTLFEADRASLRPEVSALFASAASFMAAHPALVCSLREGKAEQGLSNSLGRERRERLLTLLAEHRLSERVKWQAPEAAATTTPESYELFLTLAPPGN